MFKKKFEEIIFKYLHIYQRIIYVLNVALLAVIAPYCYFFPKIFESKRFNLPFLKNIFNKFISKNLMNIKERNQSIYFL